MATTKKRKKVAKKKVSKREKRPKKKVGIPRNRKVDRKKAGTAKKKSSKKPAKKARSAKKPAKKSRKISKKERAEKAKAGWKKRRKRERAEFKDTIHMLTIVEHLKEAYINGELMAEVRKQAEENDMLPKEVYTLYLYNGGKAA